MQDSDASGSIVPCHVTTPANSSPEISALDSASNAIPVFEADSPPMPTFNQGRLYQASLAELDEGGCSGCARVFTVYTPPAGTTDLAYVHWSAALGVMVAGGCEPLTDAYEERWTVPVAVIQPLLDDVVLMFHALGLYQGGAQQW